jgi:L-rhamnose mutarotase
MITKTFLDVQHSFARCGTVHIFSAGKKKVQNGETCQQWWELSIPMNAYFLFLHGRLAEIFET